MPRPAASLPRSLSLQVLLPRAGVLLGWLALNQWARLPEPLVFALMAADGGFLLWQFRAFQRSADAHVRSTGAMAPVWGGYLLLLFAGFAAITLWWDALLIARQPQEAPRYAEQRAREREALYSLTVSDDGRRILFSGEITFGLTSRMRQLADDHPGLETVVLSGPGGLIAEARGAAKLIRDRNLSTQATGLCASACTLIFIAGRRRSLDTEAQLGFHSYDLQIESGLPQVDVQKEQSKDRAFFLQQGISADFADKVFGIPHSRLWTPDRQELLTGGVLTE
ncbi:hypothetical protein RA19_24605 [Leisingera sp. ANG-M1]|uniref:COG3904 family protein n=1 Tax=Leisingera sp. ANG-M1 TaxID=1577895 RepID=UPI00057DAF23|nr:hypothetical protein [Leisingera sp. ANG-M1]KIC07297.1 hypothetical protein RA19_24605 [Leisingera sp. ANG-M1]